MSDKKLIEILSHAGTTEADDLLAACNQAVLLIESQADKIERLTAEYRDLGAAVRIAIDELEEMEAGDALTTLRASMEPVSGI